MEITFLTAFIVLIYTSILVEIIFFHVPSAASTYQLFFFDSDDHKTGGLLSKVHNLPLAQKLLILFVPALISLTVYCLPLILVFFPALKIHFYPIRILEQNYLIYSGLLLTVFGRGVSVHAVFRIRHCSSQNGNDFPLITDSIFRLSRNPVLIGMYITFSGLFLVFPSFVLAIGFSIYISNMHFRVLLEEDFLKHKFRDRYENYFSRTRRYI